MNGYSPTGFTGYGAPSSISTPISTTPIASLGSGGLEDLIAQAIRRRNAPLQIGANRIPVDLNQVTSGIIDPRGYYHPGQSY